ncbi:MAG: hypothetical protein ACE5HY_04330 [Candidatus Hydrothermarchaeales archaeon]
MGPKKLLKLAEKHTFSLGVRDLASTLSYQNMMYGLGKILHVTENCLCVFGPDATITRNIRRWQYGFGYGGLIKWFEDDIMFPEIMPNGCGMIVVRLDELPEKKELFESVSYVEDNEITLDGVQLKPDFGSGNHFLEFYTPLELSPELDNTMPPDCYYAVLHCSSPEKKNDLYGKIDDGNKVKTPLGPISVLDGSEAKEYLKTWKDFESFTKKRREVLMKALMEHSQMIINKTHQGMFGDKEVRLGCYDTTDTSDGNPYFPVTLRWDLPMYIIKGKENLTKESIARLRFDKRAEKLGLAEELVHANILPHGGGYRLDIPYSETEIVRSGNRRYFILKEPRTDLLGADEKSLQRYGEITFTNPRELPFEYRGKNVIEKSIEYDLGVPMAKFQPLKTLKV